MTAVSLDMLAFGVGASAQQASEQPKTQSDTQSDNKTAKATDESSLQEVVVTGFRASLQSALDRKRASNQLIESIAPEDIGKMPDKNVADAVSRVPGVTISSQSGGSGGFGTRFSVGSAGASSGRDCPNSRYVSNDASNSVSSRLSPHG